MLKNEELKTIEYVGNSFFIKWYMTDWCNYHCPYCLQASHTKDSIKVDMDDILTKAEGINHLVKVSNVTKPIFFRLIGGEPTLFDIEKILKVFNFKISNVGIVTNFFRPIDYFKSLYIYCINNGMKLNLTLSHHPENINFFNKAMELTTWCIENNLNTPEINVVVTEDFDTEFVDKYIEKGLTHIRAVRERTDLGNLNKNISKEKLDWIDKVNNQNKGNGRGSYLVSYTDGTKEYVKTMSDFTAKFDYGGLVPDGRYCSAGQTGVFIKPNGDVYPSCGGYLWREQFKLGNLTDDDLKLPTQSYMCKLNQDSKVAGKCLPCYHLNISEVKDKELFKYALKRNED